MDFSYSEEQLMVREAVIRLGSSLNGAVLQPETANFPMDSWKLVASGGLLGLGIPKEFGGGGYDCVSLAVAMEAFGYSCFDHGFVQAASIQNLCAIHINTYGSDEQKSTYLPKLCSGELIAAQAMTEPNAGSDTGAISTRAEASDNGYALNGSKVFISNGPIADVIILYAVTNPDVKVLGRTSCFLVPGDADGLVKGTPMEKMGLKSLQNGELFFSDCEITKGCLLGREGRAAAMFADSMNWERVLLFATFVGKLERVIERCVSYAQERRQFGGRIGSYQSVSGKIADMKVNHALSQLATYKAAWLIDNKASATMSASICKLFVSESCRAACIDAVQIHGGFGYMTEGGIERELRDSIAGTIYSGTSELQRVIIARLCGVQ
jgi:alkylation response protein AidB-like acyl-CoA dehydrogenase